jgi:hypothetical protein
MLQAGFHRAKLAGYTGFKSSPYTEGALFYGEKLLDATARDTNAAQAGQVVEALQEVASAPGGA